MTGKQIPRARSLRQTATLSERILWSMLRGGRLSGYKFRRQVPFGPYVADFVCEAGKLVIELDGSGHASQIAYDEERTRVIERYGYRVVRFMNVDVKNGRNGVCEAILTALQQPDC